MRDDNVHIVHRLTVAGLTFEAGAPSPPVLADSETYNTLRGEAGPGDSEDDPVENTDDA